MADEFDNGDSLDMPVGVDAVNRLISENSELFSDTHCKVCSAVLISESQKLAHYQSKKHASKYRRYLMIHQGEDFSPAKRMRAETAVSASDETDKNKCCPVCNMTFTSAVVAASHYEGKTHAKNLKVMLQGGVKEVRAPSVPKKPKEPEFVPYRSSGPIDRSDPEKFCQLCNNAFYSLEMARLHYIGKKHKRLDAKRKLMNVYSSSGTPDSASTPAPSEPKKPRETAAAPERNLGPIDRSDPEKFCQLCNATFNNPHMAQQHYAGKKHKKQETRNKIMTVYSSSGTPMPHTTPLKPLTPGSASTGNGFTCDICNIVVNSIDQYQAHITGAKHKNNLKSMEPVSFDRDMRPVSFGRDMGPVSFDRDMGPVSFDRDVGPVSFDRDVGPVSFDRDVGPVSFDRDVGPVSFDRDVGPVSFDRDMGPVSFDRDMGPVSFDSAASLQFSGLKTTRGPPSRFSFSSSGYSSAGYYSPPSSNVTSSGTAPMSHGPPPDRFGTNHGLLPLPPYASQRYEPYPHKNMPGSDGYSYFNPNF